MSVLKIESLAPFVSCTCFCVKAKTISGKLIKTLEDAGLFDFTKLLGLEDKPDGRRYRPEGGPALMIPSDSKAWGTYYVERRLPSWIAGSRGVKIPPQNAVLVDQVHQLALAVARKKFIVLLATEEMAREELETKWLEWAAGNGAPIHRVSREQLHEAFAFRPAKTLWLKGLHMPSSRRPAAKMLLGSRLQHALDPLGDQTFTYSAARCAAGDNLTVGFSPSRGRIWARASKDWTDFLKVVDRIAELLAGGRQIKDDDDPELSQLLAQPISDLSEVQRPSGLALTDPLILLPDGEQASPFLEDVIDRGSFKISSLAPSTSGSNASAEVQVELDGDQVATFHLEVSLKADATASISVTRKSFRFPDQDRQKEVDLLHAYLRRRGGFTLWYDSGHSLVDGEIFASSHRFLQFRKWCWEDFSKFPIKEEKPMIPTKVLGPSGTPRRKYDPASVGKDDASLFCWLVRQQPKCFPDEDGWLLCDDGSLETADFVHFSTSGSQLTLIHAKGAENPKNDREVSVSDYEVVVAQAMKNLHWTIPERLLARLKQRAASATPTLVWHRTQGGDWKPAEWNDFIAVLSGVKPELRRVVILQPSLRKSKHDHYKSTGVSVVTPPSELIRLWQLDYLLLSAEASCRSLGAELLVIADSSC